MSQQHIKDDEIIRYIVSELIAIANMPDNEINFVPVKTKNGYLCGVYAKTQISELIQTLTETIYFNLTRIEGITKKRVNGFVSKLKKPIETSSNGETVYYWSWLQM